MEILDLIEKIKSNIIKSLIYHIFRKNILLEKMINCYYLIIFI